jgi:hypothetical protein
MAPASLEASTSIVWDGGTESFASNNNNWSTMYSLRCNDGFYTLRNCCLMRLSRSFSFKTKPQDLDFKHRQTEEALWINRCSNPPWIRSKLSILLTQGGAQLHYCSNFQVRLEAPGHQDGKQRYFSGHTHQKKEQ